MSKTSRRRSEREKLDASQYAVTKFARDVLAVADNFQRAIEACPPEARASASPQVKSRDRWRGSDRTPVAGDAGTPWREAHRNGRRPSSIPTCIRPSPKCRPREGPKGTIVTTVQAGYMIGDRLLRPAMVTVARGEPLDTKA